MKQPHPNHGQAYGLAETFREGVQGVLGAVVFSLVYDGEYEAVLTYTLGARDALISVSEFDTAIAIAEFRDAFKKIIERVSL